MSANAPLVQKLQTSAGTVVTWGVVFGGDTALADAKHEIKTIASKLGLTNAAIYYGQGSYRSVATTTDRLQAERLLLKAKERRKDSYIVNMSTWVETLRRKTAILSVEALKGYESTAMCGRYTYFPGEFSSLSSPAITLLRLKYAKRGAQWREGCGAGDPCCAVVILLAVAIIAEAQQPKKVPRIGFVSGTGDANNPGPSTEAFRRGLRDLGLY